MSTTNLSAVATARAVRAGELSAEQVIRESLSRIEATDAALQAFVCVAKEAAVVAAQGIDRLRKAERPLGPLAGVPIGVKDIFNTIDMPTQMGSELWKGFQPGNDARVVASLRLAHGIIVGKTATAEFAVHALGSTKHPRDANRNPGTSSTGSAVAVAVGDVPVALGTQTAGSIVRPASYCGIYGFKPSFGLLPRTAMLKTTDSLDSVGMLARHAEDLRPLFDVMRVHGLDFPLSHAALNDPSRQKKPADRPWRIGLARPYTWSHAHAYAKEALAKLVESWKRADIDVVPFEMPAGLDDAHAVHATIYEKTLAYYFSVEAKNHQLISPVLNGMIERGAKITLEEYRTAIDRQDAIARSLDGAFEGIDALATLSVAGEAPLRDEDERPDSCLLWTLARLPVIGAPALTGPSGLPMGVQLIGRRYNDYRLLSLVEQLVQMELLPASSPLAGG